MDVVLVPERELAAGNVESAEGKAVDQSQPETPALEGSVPVKLLKPKMKIFHGRTAPSLRIRSGPSFVAEQLGLIKPGDSFTYSEEVDNDVGKWVRLTDEAMLQLLGSSTAPAAYALSFSKDRQQEFLEEKEVFGGLLSAKPEVSIDETGSAPPANGDKEGKEGDVRLKPVWTTKTDQGDQVLDNDGPALILDGDGPSQVLDGDGLHVNSPAPVCDDTGPINEPGDAAKSKPSKKKHRVTRRLREILGGSPRET